MSQETPQATSTELTYERNDTLAVLGWIGLVGLLVAAVTAPYNPLLFTPYATITFIIAYVIIAIPVNYLVIYHSIPVESAGEIVEEVPETPEPDVEEEVF